MPLFSLICSTTVEDVTSWTHFACRVDSKQWFPFTATIKLNLNLRGDISLFCCAANPSGSTGGFRTTKDVQSDYRKWELWGMYYLGRMPTADKRLYCTLLREAFNSFALKCFRNIWHWIVWPTVDKSVKPFGFVTRQHVSTYFWFLYSNSALCLFPSSQPQLLQSSKISLL